MRKQPIGERPGRKPPPPPAPPSADKAEPERIRAYVYEEGRGRGRRAQPCWHSAERWVREGIQTACGKVLTTYARKPEEGPRPSPFCSACAIILGEAERSGGAACATN